MQEGIQVNVLKRTFLNVNTRLACSYSGLMTKRSLASTHKLCRDGSRHSGWMRVTVWEPGKAATWQRLSFPQLTLCRSCSS